MNHRISIFILILIAATLACTLQDLADDVEFPDVLTVTKTIDTNDGSCDEDDCSLREAIIYANALPGKQTIHLPSDSPYVLSLEGLYEEEAATGDLDLTDDVRILGPCFADSDTEPCERTAKVFAAAEGEVGIDRVFHVHAGVTAEIYFMTIKYGQGFNNGGGIYNEGTLDLYSVLLQDNHSAFMGGGIYNHFTGVITTRGDGSNGVLLYNNSSKFGGGIYNVGTLTAEESFDLRFNQAVGTPVTACGGGIFNGPTGTITVQAISLLQNTSTSGGGGVCNHGNFLITGNDASQPRSVFSQNSAVNGGAFRNGSPGTATLVHTLFTNNEASSDGGAIINEGWLGIHTSALYQNTAYRGTAIFNHDIGKGLTVINSTISHNYSDSEWPGAAIYLTSGGVSLTHVTVLGNWYEPAINNAGGTVNLSSSIVAWSSGQNCIGEINSGGSNLVDDSSCGLTAAGDMNNTLPEEGILDWSTGVAFYPLDPGSPAIDAVLGGPCGFSIDQRFMARPQGVACDIGAVEFGELVSLPLVLSPIPTALEALQATLTLHPPEKQKDTVTPKPIPTEIPSKIPVQLGSISGLVWEDQNGDTNVGGGENRLGNVSVELRAGSCGASAVQIAFSNGSGEYTFSNLAPGTYCVYLNINTLPNASFGWDATTPDFPAKQSPRREFNLGAVRTRAVKTLAFSA